MTIRLDPKTAIAQTFPIKVVPPTKKRLVAHWLRDENNQLYCQWETEYEDHRK
ncbi:hypothetical protein IQ249_06320 [Lusitaniella coriacea LEGE 07157]|uniref:Uncharacterized protein n=1 Tax=Lusitaniella coriacea LEGE 07157 TaxID=945747 RepID=A0A8J7DV14_9CYAN|nr:hypothetical protein [Lusitaniella coriacea]MBE9115512.1 hypothetical protein [Lusitaniella coriacea LEGE 07157]